MALFPKNPNEQNYAGGKKHFADVIKNTGPGETLLWLNPEEDFNNNSTLIVAESEEALFFKDGIIVSVFGGGKYQLNTSNYPFISRLRNALTGGISTFNCKVYFVRKAHSLELYWGTDTPVQVRDPVFNVATNVQARGSYSIQVDDSKKFLTKLVGNNIISFTRDELNNYFRSALMQKIKTSIASVIRASNQEILGLNAQQEMLAEQIKPMITPVLDDYGVRLVDFYIASIDIPQDDPNRAMLEEAFAQKSTIGILGNDYSRVKGIEILKDLANNPGAGGTAAAGAGMGMGMAAGSVFSSIAQQAFSPVTTQFQPPQPAQPAAAGSRFAVKTPGAAEEKGKVCAACGAANPADARFCSACGTPLSAPKRHCTQCGKELADGALFCGFCGTKVQ
ncbi:MAG: SPFH domain-containing protein [Bacteroidales bacterium]|nr:SPFH domain-containing protein [Bacteroidales bacterium]